MVKLKDLIAKEEEVEKLQSQIAKIFKKEGVTESDAMVLLYLTLENIHQNCQEKKVSMDVNPVQLLNMHNAHVITIWERNSTPMPKEIPTYFG